MFSVHFSGSKALLLRFEQEISPQINAYVLSTEQRIQKALKEGEIYACNFAFFYHFYHAFDS